MKIILLQDSVFGKKHKRYDVHPDIAKMLGESNQAVPEPGEDEKLVILKKPKLGYDPGFVVNVSTETAALWKKQKIADEYIIE